MQAICGQPLPQRKPSLQMRRVEHVGHTRLVGRRALEADACLAGRRHKPACARCRDTGRRRHRRAEELQALR